MRTFSVATNEYRGQGSGERTEYHACVAWDRLAEICGQFLSKGQLVDVDGRLQTRQWDDDAGKRHWKTEVVVTTRTNLFTACSDCNLGKSSTGIVQGTQCPGRETSHC